MIRPTPTLPVTLAGAILAAGLAVVCPPCSAQESPRAASTSNAAPPSAPQLAPKPGPATQGADSSGFQSQGIKATITSISLTSAPAAPVVVQLIIRNLRQSGVYLALIGGYGGSGGTLIATNGAIYQMDPQKISGMPPCTWDMQTTDDVVKRCVENSDEHDMTMIEAGQSGILGIAYNLRTGSPAAQSDTVNFALKFIVRSAPGNGEALSAAASGTAGSPSVVTISFPLIPLSIH